MLFYLATLNCCRPASKFGSAARIYDWVRAAAAAAAAAFFTDFFPRPRLLQIRLGISFAARDFQRERET
jgi:hypothetical protein